MKRVLLKLSGEALAGEKKTGFDEPTVTVVAKQVKQLVDEGIQVGIVIGGGNFWRGRTSETIDRPKADEIGMLAPGVMQLLDHAVFQRRGCSGPGGGKGGIFRRRHRPSLFFHGYGYGAPGGGDRGGDDPFGQGGGRNL